jgi:transglycosylase-like protein with SLT domain
VSERRLARGAPALLALRAGASLIGVKVALIVAAGILVLLVVIGLFITAASSAVGQSGTTCTAAPAATGGVPADYVPWLTRAAQQYHLGPRGLAIVAAVHKIESDFGRSSLPGVRSGENFAGAGGPGQFLAPTWEAYGVDADDDGLADRYSVPDSVFATANYLHASGAPGDWHAAIFAYNHAEWYVNDVLRQAEAYQGEVVCRLIGAPLGRVELGRIDWSDTSGPWAGAQKFAELAVRIAHRHGCSVISAKRSTETTASGGVSDHWEGATHSYAVDLGGCDLTFPGGDADQAAREIAAAFDLPEHTGVVSAYRGAYRIQLLWQTYVGGDHYSHIHVGIRNVCCPAG